MPNTQEEIRRRCDDYKSHLRKVIQFMQYDHVINQYCQNIVRSCGVILDSLRSDNKHWGIGINPMWEIPIKERTVCGVPGKSYLAIAGTITVYDPPNIEQSISVSLILEPDKKQNEVNGYASGPLEPGQEYVVRRFHFDYDSTLTNNDRPRSHLQYGGNFNPDLTSKNPKYWLFKSLELPRIPQPPLDIVLTLELFLSQFETPIGSIQRKKEWIGFVKESERLWLNGYYTDIHNHIMKDGVTKSTLYQRQCNHIDWYE